MPEFDVLGRFVDHARVILGVGQATALSTIAAPQIAGLEAKALRTDFFDAQIDDVSHPLTRRLAVVAHGDAIVGLERAPGHAAFVARRRGIVLDDLFEASAIHAQAVEHPNAELVPDRKSTRLN